MKCFNPRVLGGLALAAAAVFVFAPGAFAAVLPFLVMAACPLSMVLMMRGMPGGQCSTHGRQADQQPQTAGGAVPPTSASEAEIARLRAEVDQLEAERAARNDLDRALDGPASGGDSQ